MLYKNLRKKKEVIGQSSYNRLSLTDRYNYEAMEEEEEATYRKSSDFQRHGVEGDGLRSIPSPGKWSLASAHATVNMPSGCVIFGAAGRMVHDEANKYCIETGAPYSAALKIIEDSIDAGNYAFRKNASNTVFPTDSEEDEMEESELDEIETPYQETPVDKQGEVVNKGYNVTFIDKKDYPWTVKAEHIDAPDINSKLGEASVDTAENNPEGSFVWHHPIKPTTSYDPIAEAINLMAKPSEQVKQTYMSKAEYEALIVEMLKQPKW